MTADEATMGFGTGLHPPGHSGGVIGVPIAVGEWMSFPEPPDVFENMTSILFACLINQYSKQFLNKFNIKEVKSKNPYLHLTLSFWSGVCLKNIDNKQI